MADSFKFGSRVYIRMSHIYSTIEQGRFSEHNIFLMNLILPYQIFDALEPNQVHYPRTVREMSNQRRRRPSPAVSKT